MHELALCDSIVGIVRRHAGGDRVAAVQIRVGALRQVLPDALRMCWSAVATSAELGGALLDVEEVPARVECRDCRERAELVDPLVRCPKCGGCDVTILSGTEFCVASIDVVPRGRGGRE